MPQGEVEEYEDSHVHQVYEKIASHFSSTRYKPWPKIESFLTSRPDGSVGLDVGCGNGKYLAVNSNIFIVGSDRSTNLVNIAAHHDPQDCIVADNLSLPHPSWHFDFAISVAVVHHLSTTARRVEAIGAILETLKSAQGNAAAADDCSQALFYVWALEQKSSRRGWDEGDEQDVMVPWVMKQEIAGKVESQTCNRYYHLYCKGELERDIDLAGGKVVDSGYEKDNWWAIATRKNPHIS